jgi:hypothetical protein
MCYCVLCTPCSDAAALLDELEWGKLDLTEALDDLSNASRQPLF